ncbi:Coronin-7 [Boothiomyces sp. JEL0838]|nr:Coronin-7 [Boothiomyces sp. JEL0838]
MIDNGQGIMSLMYDDDSGMAFIAGRGDSKISWCEFNPTNPKLPLDTQRLPFSFSSTFIGATLVPKLALNVMEGEVNRILAITNDGSIVPVIIRVPRKSYLDFHGDIFPDTLKGIPYLSPEDWNSGKEPILERVSLDPKKSKTSETKPQTTPTSGVENPGFNGVSTPPSLQTLSVKEGDKEVKQSPASKIDLPKHSSFKHLAVTQKLLLDDLKTGPVTASNESNGFEINSKYFAFRMAGSGGRVGIYSVKATGRFATKIPTIINGVELCDFKFHPFNDNLLITGCEDGKIREFSIPENGLEDDLTSARRVFSAHSNRITLILFHTRVTDLLLTSSPENGVPAIKIWDCAKEQCLQNIAVPDMVLTVAFKNDGNLFSAITKNSEILVYNLQSGKLASKGSSHKGSKAARLMWSNDQLISVGYSRLVWHNFSGSQREILVYKDTDVTSTIGNVIIDSSPSFLIPYLDEDTNVLILAAKGEGVMMFYEIDGSTPVFLNKAVLPLGNTVAFANLPKTSADVKGIEIIKGYRLTQTAITQLSFTVPRLRKEYFQDDIYPPTIDYTASLKISDWLQGKPVSEKRINLCPSGMTPLSKAPVETVQRAHIPTFAEVRSEEDQKQASIKAMFEMANQESKGPLVQDMLEGVADDEWFGFVAIVKYSKLWNVELVLKPVFLGGIMKGSENQPPANNPVKGAYMNKVIESKSPSDLVPASLALWKQYWANGKVFNLENMVESLSPILGKNTKSIFEESTTGPVKAALQSATKEALDSGSFGAPWFVVEKDQQKQTFFGSDRLEAIACFLEEQYVGLNPDQPLNSKL